MRLMNFVNRRPSEGVGGGRESGSGSSRQQGFHHHQDLEEIAVVSNATPSQVTYGLGAQTANGPRVVPGTITSGRMGERLSISGGTKVSGNTSGGSFLPPSSSSGAFRASTESLQLSTQEKCPVSVSKQSLLDIVSSKINKSKAPQRYFSRESLTTSYANRVMTTSEAEINRSHKTNPRRRSQDHRSKVKSCSSVSGGGYMKKSSSAGSNMDYYERYPSGFYNRKSSHESKGRRPFGVRWTFVFDPAGRISYYWQMIVSLAFLYNLWIIIFRMSFCEINRDTFPFWFSLDYFCDLVYLLDILIHFRIGYQEDGVLQTDSKKLRNHYMNSTKFYIDCLCLLPIDFLYLSIGFNSALRFPRLIKVYRFMTFMDRTERHTNYPNVFRSCNLLHYLLAIFHWNGCIYHLIYRGKGFASKNWVFPDHENATVLRQYLQSYYWCTLALTTIGDLPKPRSNFEYFYVIFQLLMGLLLFAAVLGHVASIVVNVSAARKEFQAKLDGVKTYMRMRRVPTPLQNKVIRWFDYLWMTQKCSDEEKAISCLPDVLKAEIAINVHLDTLKRVEIFQNTEAGFLRELVLKLRPVLFSPGDFICKKGEVGKEMYIVSRGRLQVMADDLKTVLATLKAGSYFGEISILNMGTEGNRRTASVRSVGYSHLFVLSKRDMWEVLKEYPAARIRLEAVATRRLEKYRTDPFPLDMPGFFGRRCKSTPGILETQEDAWLYRNHRVSNNNDARDTIVELPEPRHHYNPNDHYTLTPSPTYRINVAPPPGSPISGRSSVHSSDHDHSHISQQYSDKARLLTPHSIPTISQTISETSVAGELSEVVTLKAEITRLREYLKDVENQNQTLNEKLTQQQWNMNHRLAEIEMQICRDTSSVGSSGDENECNRESVI